MAFYIIEKSSQLTNLKLFKDCFVHFIPTNNNFHPALSQLSLIYIRSLNDYKGYIFCLNHNEAFSLGEKETLDWIENNTNKLFVLDKKQTLHFYNKPEKLFDINFIELVDLSLTLDSTCINFYQTKYNDLSNVNCLIPISKHYEKFEELFQIVLPIIEKYDEKNEIYKFNNEKTCKIFFQIEKNGIKVSKSEYINYYKSIKNPEFNLYKGKIYTQYNLYTTTSRPSNTFNNINFAALNKDDGERDCYISENDMFLELDIQGMHPRIIGNLVGSPFPKFKNTYEILADILDVNKAKAKELTFKQLYGGVWPEFRRRPFFEDVHKYVKDLWEEFNKEKQITTENKIFFQDTLKDITPQKLFNYIIQSYETSTNVVLLEQMLGKLNNCKTKLILYTYDSFLFDFDKADEKTIQQIINESPFLFNIKQGKSYHGLKKI